MLFRPQVKLYANGVLLIHLIPERGDKRASFTGLLDGYVNLQTRAAENLVLSPEVLLAAERLSIIANAKGVRARARQIRERRAALAPAIQANAVGGSEDGERWGVGVAPVPEGPWPQPPNLYDLYDYHRDAVESCIDLGHTALSASIRGRKSLRNAPSIFWNARPSVHVLDSTADLSDYLTTGSPAELELSRLLARSSSLTSPMSGHHDANLRPAGDYLFFHNEALTAFVSGPRNSASEEEEEKEPSGPVGFVDEAVTSRQALVESLQYLQVSLEALGQRAYHVEHGLEGCFALRSDLLHLQTLMRSGLSGEVNAAFSHASTVFNFPDTSSKIREVLDQVSQLQVDRRNYRLEYMGLGLTVLLLLAATPSITDAFVAPVMAQITGRQMESGTTESLHHESRRLRRPCASGHVHLDGGAASAEVATRRTQPGLSGRSSLSVGRRRPTPRSAAASSCIAGIACE